MDLAAIIALAVKYGPIVKGIIDAAISNTTIIDKIKAEAAPVVNLLEQIGSKLFPSATKQIQQLGGALAAFDPNTTKWLQGALNVLVTPSPNLKVDGSYGPLTAAAVKAFQTQHSLTIDGVAGMITQAAINAALSKLPVLK